MAITYSVAITLIPSKIDLWKYVIRGSFNPLFIWPFTYLFDKVYMGQRSYADVRTPQQVRKQISKKIANKIIFGRLA